MTEEQETEFERAILAVHIAAELSLKEAQFRRLHESHTRLLASLKALLHFNEELCADINVSKHYPSAEQARAAIAAAEGLAP